MHQPSSARLSLRRLLWLHSTHATGTGFVGKLWFRERPAQAGQVGTTRRPDLACCMEAPGRRASQSATGLNPADRDEVPSQSDAQSAPWSDVRNGGRLVRSGCGLRFAGALRGGCSPLRPRNSCVPARNVELTPAFAPSARGHRLGMQISRRSMLARVDVPLAALTTHLLALIYVRPYYLMVILGQ